MREATVICGECVVEMSRMEPESFDLVLTDPPYDLTANKRGGSGPASLNVDSPAGRSRIGTGFMGKAWDGTGVAFKVETWRAALRILKPGGHLVAFGGTRTHHRLMCAIEDAGFEIRDVLMWLHGEGFPKSLDLSKAIDKAAGAVREVLGRKWESRKGGGLQLSVMNDDNWQPPAVTDAITAPATALAQIWQGYGTALKPAFEPIVWAMKPLAGTFASNAERHGVAGIHVDAGRIDGPAGDGVWGSSNASCAPLFNNSPEKHEFRSEQHPLGRWPANVILDEVSAEMLDLQAGPQVSGGTPLHRFSDKTRNAYGKFTGDENPAGIGRSAGLVSRFFYCAKAAQSERELGLEGCAARQPDAGRDPDAPGGNNPRNRGARTARNHHPTVKPLDLMKYLLRVFDTPTGGKVLDPFMGSGTTGVACAELGRRFVGIEMAAEYCEIARRRIEAATKQGKLGFDDRDQGDESDQRNGGNRG